MEEICRLCCSTKFVKNNIFEENNALFSKMSLYMPIKLQKGDRLPQRICDRCCCKVNDLYQFCKEAIEVQNKFNAIFSYDKEADTFIDLTLIKRDTDSPLPRCDDKEADTSIDLTLIKRDTDSPLPRYDDKEADTSIDLALIKRDTDSPLPRYDDKEADTSIDLALIKRDTDSPLPRYDDKEADTSIDLTLIKRDTDSPLLRCDKSTQTSEQTTNLLEVKITEEPKQTVPTPIKEELPDDDNAVLSSDSDDEVLSKIQGRKYLTSPNVKEQENAILFLLKNQRKTNKKSKVNRKKKLPAKLLAENDVNVLQEDNRVRPQDPFGHQVHFCCICFKSYTYNKADMIRHYKTHVNRAKMKIRPPRAPPLPAKKPFRCMRCRKTVLKAKYWAAHWRQHWKQDRRLYDCGMCDLTFNNERHIYNHGKTHKPGEERIEQPKPFMCDSCDETFQFPRCLLAHRTHAHFETVALPQVLRCSTCKQLFTHVASLERHQRVHTGERKHRCKVCRKALTTREILKVHMRIHTGQKPFKCSVCDMRFSAKTNIKKHMRVHTGEKPYECRHCGKAFSQSSALVIHERYHTGERPYKCEQCDRRFVARALLTVHLKTCTDLSQKKKAKVSEKTKRSRT